MRVDEQLRWVDPHDLALVLVRLALPLAAMDQELPTSQSDSVSTPKNHCLIVAGVVIAAQTSWTGASIETDADVVSWFIVLMEEPFPRGAAPKRATTVRRERGTAREKGARILRVPGGLVRLPGAVVPGWRRRRRRSR